METQDRTVKRRVDDAPATSRRLGRGVATLAQRRGDATTCRRRGAAARLPVAERRRLHEPGAGGLDVPPLEFRRAARAAAVAQRSLRRRRPPPESVGRGRPDVPVAPRHPPGPAPQRRRHRLPRSRQPQLHLLHDQVARFSRPHQPAPNPSLFKSNLLISAAFGFADYFQSNDF